MHEHRKKLRALLCALIAEREDSAALYIPNGEPGMRRMIRALLDMRPPKEDDHLAEQIAEFLQSEENPSSSDPIR